MSRKVKLFIVEDTEARFTPSYYLTDKMPESTTQVVVDSFEVVAPKHIVDWLVDGCFHSDSPDSFKCAPRDA